MTSINNHIGIGTPSEFVTKESALIAYLKDHGTKGIWSDIEAFTEFRQSYERAIIQSIRKAYGKLFGDEVPSADLIQSALHGAVRDETDLLEAMVGTVVETYREISTTETGFVWDDDQSESHNLNRLGAFVKTVARNLSNNIKPRKETSKYYFESAHSVMDKRQGDLISEFDDNWDSLLRKLERIRTGEDNVTNIPDLPFQEEGYNAENTYRSLFQKATDPNHRMPDPTIGDERERWLCLPDTPTPHEQAPLREFLEVALKRLNHMLTQIESERQKEVFYGVYYGLKSKDVVAEEMGLSERQVDDALSKVRTRARYTLDDLPVTDLDELLEMILVHTGRDRTPTKDETASRKRRV